MLGVKRYYPPVQKLWGHVPPLNAVPALMYSNFSVCYQISFSLGRFGVKACHPSEEALQMWCFKETINDR